MGVTHSDLQTEAAGVLRPRGIVKVLDFGLAKMLTWEQPPVGLSRRPTIAVDGSVEGVIAGTAAERTSGVQW